MLENLTYFLNGASLSFFAMGAFHMAIYATGDKTKCIKEEQLQKDR